MHGFLLGAGVAFPIEGEKGGYFWDTLSIAPYAPC